MGIRRRLAASAVAGVVAASASACAALAPSIPVGKPRATAVAATTVPGAASPSASPSRSPQPPAVRVSAAAAALTAQLGVQVYWHTMGDEAQVRSAADRVLDYVVGLGANSVGITFPVFTDGVHPTRVYPTPGATPDPATLRIVIGEAQARGLRVMLRPLIDEGNIKDSAGDWRGTIAPPSAAAWFASYTAFLKPYLALAQQTGAQAFVVGAELNSLMRQAAQWSDLDARARQIFTGPLEYADNWDTWANGGSYAPAPSMGVDAYPDMRLGDGASVGELTTAWTAWLRSRPSGVLAKTIIQEVGIAAASGSYAHPARWATAGQRLDTRIQVDWFAAACQSARALHMPGIYFWDVDSNADPAAAASADTSSFIGRGDASIRACFAADWGR